MPRHRAAGGIGLALAGGGPLGGIYEVGTLLALADSIENLDCNALDVYVGVSSGSFVAAALANGISPAQMYRLFIEDGKDAALKPELFLRAGAARVRPPVDRVAGTRGACARFNTRAIRSIAARWNRSRRSRGRYPRASSTIARSTPF